MGNVKRDELTTGTACLTLAAAAEMAHHRQRHSKLGILALDETNITRFLVGQEQRFCQT